MLESAPGQTKAGPVSCCGRHPVCLPPGRPADGPGWSLWGSGSRLIWGYLVGLTWSPLQGIASVCMREGADGETATQLLHRLTSYEPGRHWTAPVGDPRVVQDLQVNDQDRLPWFVKRYPPGLPRLPLPRELPGTAAPAISVLAGSARVAPADLDLPHLSRLLYLSAGVVRTMERPYGIHPFRAAGSAGGRFPLELYVAVPGGGSLPPGVHWYDPLEHALVRVGPAPHGGAPAVIVTGVPWRTGWRYRERGWRHVYWDAGTMLAQLLALADSAGLAAALYTTFPTWQWLCCPGRTWFTSCRWRWWASGALRPLSAQPGPRQQGGSTRHPLSFPSSPPRSGRGNATGSACPGTAAPRSASRPSPRRRWKPSSPPAGRSGG